MASDNQNAEETKCFTEESINNEEVVLRSYKRKWLVALVLSILSFSSAMSRMAFGPVAYASAEFYQTEVFVVWASSFSLIESICLLIDKQNAACNYL